ncbi:MAG: hypothetical protein U0869_13905 [Chloroflexota bacterium]
MSWLNVGLWAVGVLLLVVGVVRVRLPLAKRRALDETTANLARYDEWRGNRLRPEPGERTGADEMRDMLRTQTILWSGVAVAGIVCIVLGFLVK